MHDVSSLLVWAVFWDAQLVRWVVWVGLVVLTVALLLLVRTRWGHSQPLGKCVVLSLLAHLLLGIYMTTVNIVTATVGSPDGKGIQVALVDQSAGDENITQADRESAWDAVTGEGPLEGFAAAPDASLPPPVSTELPNTAEPQRSRSEPDAALMDIKPLEIPASDEPLPPTIVEPIDPIRSRTVKSAEPIESLPLERAPDPLVPPPDDVDPTPALEPTTKPPANAKSRNETIKPSDAQRPGDGGFSTQRGGDPLAPQGATVKAAPLPEIYKLRVGNHSQVAKGLGATPQSEGAVNAALRFLAANQNAAGRWEARRLAGGAGRASDGQDRQAAGSQADTAITGLALLSFLAAGNTHLQGQHQLTVRRGLDFLLDAQESNGNLGVSTNIYERMYSHAMATCALSEAYAMSGDTRLESAVRRAIGFTLAAQDRGGGGWRYHPFDAARQPPDPGDTSQLGWQVMALKSAQLAGIPIPEGTRDGIVRFLKSVSDGHNGGLARYQPTASRRVSRPMTAEALVCRQFLGIQDPLAHLSEATNYLLAELPGAGTTNHYYWYYATLALYQAQGDSWQRWNDALQKQLLATQVATGELAGSWDPDPVWGGCGGRTYSTALATLCLEVYYRYLPLYVQEASREKRAQ